MAATSNAATTATARPPQNAEQAALGKAVGTLRPNDSATLSMNAGGQWNIASLGAQAQAQAGASITVTNVSAPNKPGYQVTLTETQQAGISGTSGDEDPEPSASECSTTDQSSSKSTSKVGIGSVVPAPVYDPVSGGGFSLGMPRIGIFDQTESPQREGGSGETECQTQATTSGSEQSQSSLSTQPNTSTTYTYTVTVTVKTKSEAVQAANTFATMATTPSKPGNLVDNPIMDEINGKSGRPSGVSSSELGLLKNNLTSYGETLSASAGVVANNPLFANNNFGQLSVSVGNQLSLSRTVTMPSDGSPANVAYTLSEQTSTAPTIGFLGGAGSDQESEQGQISYSQQYNLLTKKEIANPEASLGGRWLTPNVVQETFQTQTQLGPTVSFLPHGSSAGGKVVRTTTITATYTNPKPTALNSRTAQGIRRQARQTFRSDGSHPASSKPQSPKPPPGSNLSWKTTTTTTDNSSITVGSWPINATLTTSIPM
jgi:hypothetical protein